MRRGVSPSYNNKEYNIYQHNVGEDSDISNGALLVVDDDHDGYDILQSNILELFCMNIQ